MSKYEKERQALIARNKKIFEALEIPKVSKALEEKCQNEVEKTKVQARRKTAVRSKRVKTYTTIRRSRRLRGQKPQQLSESALANPSKKPTTRSKNSNEIRTFTEEVYSLKHLKSLGSYKKKWTLFVDGYVNGERVYNSIKGTTCHQCRQKTIARHTECTKCKKYTGRYCGDCLFMRYGENLDEVSKKDDWTCPVCRDICNCSFCRLAKGWEPTGNLFRKATVEKGFKSIHSENEVVEFLGNGPGGLLVNIGTLDPAWQSGMCLAVKRAKELGTPWVLDPVAAGATSVRTEFSKELLKYCPTVIRGNASEIHSLAGKLGNTKGVESTLASTEALASAKVLAKGTGSIVAVTGADDYVTDGEAVLKVSNGVPLMQKITATGCALSAVIAAFVSASSSSALEATAFALAVYGYFMLHQSNLN
eukprot:g1299.t1